MFPNKPNRLVIFDLDGVLVDSRDLHFEAFNRALKTHVPEFKDITYAEHVAQYDGLSTRRKLEKLTKNRGLDPATHTLIAIEKQNITLELLDKSISPNPFLRDLMDSIHNQGWKIAVATNAVRSTLVKSLIALDIALKIDYTICNEDVGRNKPYPDMFWEIMRKANAVPSTTIIVEDSHIGRLAVKESGATLIPVTEVCKIPTEELFERMSEIDDIKQPNVPWLDKNLTIVIPMAGAGSRFVSAGFTFPKPLIEIHGKPMIQVVVENLKMPNAQYVFVVLKDMLEKYNLEPFLKLLAPMCQIYCLEKLTEGAAMTVKIAVDAVCKSHSHVSENPMVIANSDQFLEWNVNEAMYAFSQKEVDGGILTFEATHPKWSFVSLDNNGFVKEVAEKKAISNHATCGVYYWSHAYNFKFCAEEMFSDETQRVNGEWYVAPVFNKLIKHGGAIRTKEIERMWGLGTPEDLQYFMDNYKGKI